MHVHELIGLASYAQAARAVVLIAYEQEKRTTSLYVSRLVERSLVVLARLLCTKDADTVAQS